jgi:hypothetical protein
MLKAGFEDGFIRSDGELMIAGLDGGGEAHGDLPKMRRLGF